MPPSTKCATPLVLEDLSHVVNASRFDYSLPVGSVTCLAEPHPQFEHSCDRFSLNYEYELPNQSTNVDSSPVDEKDKLNLRRMHSKKANAKWCREEGGMRERIKAFVRTCVCDGKQ